MPELPEVQQSEKTVKVENTSALKLEVPDFAVPLDFTYNR